MIHLLLFSETTAQCNKEFQEFCWDLKISQLSRALHLSLLLLVVLRASPPRLAQILITAHEDSAGMDVKFFSPSQMLSLQSRVGESRLYGTVCRMLCTTIFLRYYRDELSGAAILTLSLWAKFSQSASFPLKWI